MMDRRLLVVAFVFSLLCVGCGGSGDDAALSPASDYRRAQLDRALAGVSVVDGLIVAEPAAALPSGAIRAHGPRSMICSVGDAAPAIERAVAGVRGAPDDAGNDGDLGPSSAHHPRTEIALASFKTAVNLDPSDADAHFLWVWLSIVSAHRVGAMAAWREVLNLGSEPRSSPHLVWRRPTGWSPIRARLEGASRSAESSRRGGPGPTGVHDRHGLRHPQSSFAPMRRRVGRPRRRR